MNLNGTKFYHHCRHHIQKKKKRKKQLNAKSYATSNVQWSLLLCIYLQIVRPMSNNFDEMLTNSHFELYDSRFWKIAKLKSKGNSNHQIVQFNHSQFEWVCLRNYFECSQFTVPKILYETLSTRNKSKVRLTVNFNYNERIIIQNINIIANRIFTYKMKRSNIGSVEKSKILASYHGPKTWFGFNMSSFKSFIPKKTFFSVWNNKTIKKE